MFQQVGSSKFFPTILTFRRLASLNWYIEGARCFPQVKDSSDAYISLVGEHAIFRILDPLL